MSLRSWEEYLKFRISLFKTILPIWKYWSKRVNQDTGKKSEPRIQFTLVQYLQDVLDDFAKKLIVLLNISDLDPDFIHKLGHLFRKQGRSGDFEIMELKS
jgi:DNA polymerase-3 subunit alpha